jgi:hypothetical protein
MIGTRVYRYQIVERLGSGGRGISCLYPTYIKGQAYLAAGQGRSAAGEFQKIIDHSGLVSNCWTGALAHLGVARANALEAKSQEGADLSKLGFSVGRFGHHVKPSLTLRGWERPNMWHGFSRAVVVCALDGFTGCGKVRTKGTGLAVPIGM